MLLMKIRFYNFANLKVLINQPNNPPFICLPKINGYKSCHVATLVLCVYFYYFTREGGGAS